MAEEQGQLVSKFIGSNKPLKVVSRADWGARNPKQVHPMEHPVKHVVCTFTRTAPCFTEISCKHFIKRFQKFHQSVKKRLDISYNFLIGFDGTVYEGRGWHTYTELYYFIPKGETEYEGIHIALIGNFDREKPPPPEMFKSMQNLVDFGVKNNFITEDYALHLL